MNPIKKHNAAFRYILRKYKSNSLLNCQCALYWLFEALQLYRTTTGSINPSSSNISGATHTSLCQPFPS